MQLTNTNGETRNNAANNEKNKNKKKVSAMLRSLVRTGKEKESYPAWPSIEEGLEAKRELERCREYYEHQLLPTSLETTAAEESKVRDKFRGLQRSTDSILTL